MTMKHLTWLALATLSACAPTLAPAQTVSGCGTAAIAKADAKSITKLTTGADCFGKAKAVAAAAEQARRERIFTLTPKPVPTPSPTPTPAPVTYPPLPEPPVIPPPPAFVPTATIAPSLEGVAKVASGLDPASLLQKSWGTGDLPGPEAPSIEGAFRFLCAPSHLSYDDMVVYPGQPGKSHLHQWYGNTKADAFSTYANLRVTGDSTCNSALNRSAYALPAMMRPDGKVVQPDYTFIYYKQPPADSKFCAPPYAKACLPLPRGLRYVFGYNVHDASDPINKAPPLWYNCDGPGAVSGHFRTIAEAAKGCPIGARLGALVVSANCWTGKDLDSPDHRAHMAYQRQDGYGRNVCPATHPYLLPFFEPGAWFTVDATLAEWRLSSDQPGQPGGWTLHSDWFGAWEDSIQALWWANCINKALSCSGGGLGNGTQLRTDKGYDYPHGRPLLDPPAMPVMSGMTH